MKKLVLCFFIIALTFMSLVACNNYSTENSSYKINSGDISKDNNGIKGSYKEYNGYYEYSVKFTTEEVKFHIDSETLNGDINIKLIDKEKNEVFSVEKPDDFKKDVEINKDEKYTIVIEGKNHEGDFNIKWE
ncbi:hypothetical protein IO99_00220 [Clostridium sulfidigenes]|uniref:Lipoprotein n=1 Tax=Clostridium sulfidigenes TaxID=318464 RepID=A0A084JI62_9CLOT|nr:hypothetical protein [Clostridium sulfidigenes]KEZ88646.1 hypothetical protein IO99_00220 [Clostridium sulfidigenes]